MHGRGELRSPANNNIKLRDGEPLPYDKNNVNSFNKNFMEKRAADS